jgi:tetratricopeptide (TPR) repeat protein
MKFVVVLMAVAASAAIAADPGLACRTLERTGKRAEAQGCFQKLTASSDAWARAEGFYGLHSYDPANEQFKAALTQHPKNPDVRVRWGRFFIERYNKNDAQGLFKEALELNPKHAGATFGLALNASDGFEQEAVELANKALELDPKLVEAQELLAKLALEDNNEAKAIIEADKALKMSPGALDAMAVRFAIDLLDDKKSSEWEARIKAANPFYGEAWAFAGHILVLNRRYEEGIAAYKTALQLNPNLQWAQAQLGVNLMRLGLEKEARDHLEGAYKAGFKNALTANSLTLMDSYKNFVTFRTPTTVVRLQKKEAELLRPYIEGELKRAIATFDKKYKVKLDKPVQIEMYPNHEDFAVRTLGMPGLGALGVTFGTVVAMDSPSGRPPGAFHWASTLWHELSHVYVLTATKHRVPRWFTEGMAVHEETAASKDWGDRLDPTVIGAIRDKKLLPVAQLDRGFIRPSYRNQVIVSYFQAGRICDYINEKYGYQKLLDMMNSFAQSKSTAEVIETHFKMKPEEFDTEFLAWLNGQVKETVDNFADWRKRMKLLQEAASKKNHDEVVKAAPEVIAMYRDFVEARSAYELLSEAQKAKGNAAAALDALQQYSNAGGRNPETLKKLAKMQTEAGKPADAIKTLERLLYIFPMEEEVHRDLGDLYMSQNALDGAIREYGAVLASKPVDPAASHFNLARALHGAKRTDDAKEHLLLSLEAAPGYKPAQRLLLDLSR